MNKRAVGWLLIVLPPVVTALISTRKRIWRRIHPIEMKMGVLYSMIWSCGTIVFGGIPYQIIAACWCGVFIYERYYQHCHGISDEEKSRRTKQAKTALKVFLQGADCREKNCEKKPGHEQIIDSDTLYQFLMAPYECELNRRSLFFFTGFTIRHHRYWFVTQLLGEHHTVLNVIDLEQQSKTRCKYVFYYVEDQLDWIDFQHECIFDKTARYLNSHLPIVLTLWSVFYGKKK